ncbi:hypothetical protein JCM8547_000712 [Rhodosporidiobolus lusitaniae]
MTYAASWSPSAPAFHPKLVLSFPPSLPSSSSCPANCDLYALLRVPPGLIADRYELQRLHEGGRLGAYGEETRRARGGGRTLEVLGEGDLEAPVYKVEEREGGGWAAVLLTLKKGGEEGEGKGKEKAGQEEEERWEVVIPLHTRYQRPVEKRYDAEGRRVDRVEVEVEKPWVFWAYEGGVLFFFFSPGSPLVTFGSADYPPSYLASLPTCSPPSLPSNLSFPSLSSLSLFYLTPSASSNISSSSSCPPPLGPPLTLSLPTGVQSDLPLVETTTFLVIWATFAWVSWSAYRLWRRLRVAEREKEGKKE